MDRAMQWLGWAIFAVGLGYVIVTAVAPFDAESSVSGRELQITRCSSRMIEAFPGGSDACGQTARSDLTRVGLLALPALVVGVTSISTSRVRRRRIVHA